MNPHDETTIRANAETRPMTVSVYKDAADKYRWRLVAGNGEKFAPSQGYTRKFSAERAAKRLVEAGKQGIVLAL